MSNKVNHGSEFRRAMDHYLASLIQKRDFSTAVRHYENHRTELDGSGEAVVGSIHCHAATAYAALSNYPVALRTARLAQHLVASHGESALLAEVFVTLGRVLRDMGEWKEAEKAFRDAESIFRRRDCPADQCRVLNLLAGLFYRAADYRNALAVLIDAVALARTLDDPKMLAFMMGNIGRIYTFLGKCSEAEQHLQTNIKLSSDLDDDLEVTRAYLALGYLYLQQGRFTEAEGILDQAHQLLVTGISRRDEVIYLTYLGELRYQSGRLEEAEQALKKALNLAEDIDANSTLAARVMRHLAELCVRQEDYASAKKLAAEAMVVMERAGNQVETGALWKIKAGIEAASGKSDRAREYFVKAIDTLREAGVRFEEAQALVAAGNCEHFPIRRRLTYLFRAEEFYRRTESPARLRELERIVGAIDYPTAINTGSGDAVSDADEIRKYLTNSDDIKRFKDQLPSLGRSDLTLLLLGETGVGKDHMARYYHRIVRPQGPFVAVNCASLPAGLLESELFGYEKGAFTGADRSKPGLFKAADGGVLFLDEIGDIPLPLQVKLLGVLETKRITPVGATIDVPLDVKLVAATNKKLSEMIEHGTFRQDLYFRLSGYTYHIPALRERKEDIPLLLHHFMEKCRLLKRNEKIPTELAYQFVEYDWPGNVRELDSKVKQLKVMAELAAAGDLVELTRSIIPRENPPVVGSLFERVEHFERQMLIEALLASGGNKSEAARILGIHEATVRTKLKRYNLNVSGGAVH